MFLLRRNAKILINEESEVIWKEIFPSLISPMRMICHNNVFVKHERNLNALFSKCILFSPVALKEAKIEVVPDVIQVIQAKLIDLFWFDQEGEISNTPTLTRK